MTEFPTLFSRARLGRHEAKNRLVMAPMVRNYADESGLLTDRYRAHLERIAAGGTGTLVLDACFVRPDGRGFTNQLAIDRDETIAGFSELVDIAHRHGALIGPQLYHAGRQTTSEITGVQPVAPSALAGPLMQEEPRSLRVDEIADIVAAFGRATRRAREAGCDLVEIHGAHGYLIAQFLSAFTNERDDEYGGDLEHRMRFLVEIVEAVRREAGEMAVIVRLSGDEMVPDGLELSDTLQIAERLEQLGVDAVHISAGNYASYESGMMIQPMAIEDAPLVPLASAIKGAVSIPVITVGKIRMPDRAESILRDGHADFIALGRPLLADPDWPRKAEHGDDDAINICIACNQGCTGRLFAQDDIWCTVNPETGREREFAQPVGESRRVLVAGGGPAGMEAARVAAERGHHVELWERSDRLGGQLNEAVVPPHRPGWGELRDHLQRQLERLGVEVHLGEPATADVVREQQPDVVIAALGAEPSPPSMDGFERDNVVFGIDVLSGVAEPRGDVVVAGGGCNGAQTAEHLARLGHPVTIVEMTGSIADDAPLADRSLLLGRLDELGVDIRTEASIRQVDEDSVIVDQDGHRERIACDTVVVCLGMRSVDGLPAEIEELPVEVVLVGDAVEPRKVTDAMIEGARAALAIS